MPKKTAKENNNTIDEHRIMCVESVHDYIIINMPSFKHPLSFISTVIHLLATLAEEREAKMMGQSQHTAAHHQMSDRCLHDNDETVAVINGAPFD